MSSGITPTKIGIRHIRIAFPLTFCMRIIKKLSELGENKPIFSVQMCTQMRFCVYGVTPMENLKSRRPEYNAQAVSLE